MVGFVRISGKPILTQRREGAEALLSQELRVEREGAQRLVTSAATLMVCMVSPRHFRSETLSFVQFCIHGQGKGKDEFHECRRRERNMTSLAFLESERACTLEACDTADWEICATTKVQGLRVRDTVQTSR